MRPEVRDARERPLVLVVDDDAPARFILTSVLKESGFDVAEAADGAEGVDRVAALLPDLVIMDVVMPEMDGFTACATLRALPAGMNVPVLMLTGLEDVAAFHRSFDAGASDFATKPISPAMLSHRVRFMLRASTTLAELRSSEARLAEAQRIAQLGHWECDLALERFRGSPEANAALGLEPGVTASGDALLERVHPDGRADLRRAFQDLIRGAGPLDHQFHLSEEGRGPRFIHVRGELVRDHSGTPSGLRGTLQDITDRVRAEEQIRLLAYHDSLTDLPNHHLFANRLQSAISHAGRNGSKVATMALNLNNFKQINDTFGHKAGDAVLIAVARRLRDAVRVYDEVACAAEPGKASTIARLGGDEFLFAIQDLSSGEDAASIARRLLDALQAPLPCESRELFLSGNVGVSLFPDDGGDVDDLVKHADTAVHQAKASGPNAIAFFNRAMNERVTQRLLLETELRRALDAQAIFPHYQPLVDGRSGRIVGVEALSRWTHPELGAVSPAEFVPLAERLGLIDTLTDHTVRSACAELLTWSRQGLPAVYASINISGQQFKNKDLATAICALVRGEGIEPERITLEVTEGVLVENMAEGERALAELKAHGFRIAIDDFGTGYSSLSYLKRFPIDILKIDRAFVREADRNARDGTILAAIIGLARALGVEPLAEGVETVQQRDVLLASGCHMMQGFLFSKAVPAADLAALLARGVAAPPGVVGVAAAAGRT